jgi:hypothetical protein
MRRVHTIAAGAATAVCLIVATGVALASDSGAGPARSPAVHKPVQAPANLIDATTAAQDTATPEPVDSSDPAGDETVDEQQGAQGADQTDTPDPTQAPGTETDDPSDTPDTPDASDTPDTETDDADDADDGAADASDAPDSPDPSETDSPDPGDSGDSATQ